MSINQLEAWITKVNQGMSYWLQQKAIQGINYFFELFIKYHIINFN